MNCAIFWNGFLMRSLKRKWQSEARSSVFINYDVGDISRGNALNAILSDVLEFGSNKGNREWRQGVLGSYASYAKTDPALMGAARAAAVGSVLANPRIVAEAPEIASAGSVELPERGLTPYPSRGGRLGSPATRTQNAEIAADLKKKGFIITGGGGVAPEEYIRGAGPGTRGGVFVDITAMDKETGAFVRVQTIDTLADGNPTPREVAAAARIRAAYPNDRLMLIPKRSAR
jgi:hypothetical protein